ncbi:hypothetical protein TeGR_g14915 [Tetraparma gracilis]|uniref:RanBP2-type domain-containing protein n=1 Tax=Tetraparma gracilis TaxID=2962635 RepID=A0ABQ6NAH9_9STRA|nr:hypothetical protein TeGR_g14915 [Tetraparma gracilis]
MPTFSFASAAGAAPFVGSPPAESPSSRRRSKDAARDAAPEGPSDAIGAGLDLTFAEVGEPTAAAPKPAAAEPAAAEAKAAEPAGGGAKLRGDDGKKKRRTRAPSEGQGTEEEEEDAALSLALEQGARGQLPALSSASEQGARGQLPALSSASEQGARGQLPALSSDQDAGVVGGDGGSTIRLVWHGSGRAPQEHMVNLPGDVAESLAHALNAQVGKMHAEGGAAAPAKQRERTQEELDARLARTRQDELDAAAEAEASEEEEAGWEERYLERQELARQLVIDERWLAGESSAEEEDAESEEDYAESEEEIRAHLRDNLDPDVHNAIAEQVSLLSLPPSMLFGPVSALNRMFKEFQAKETPVAVARYLALLCIRQLMEVLPVLETSSFLAAAELLENFLELGMPVTTALRTPYAQEAMAKIVLSVVATPGNPPSPIACSRARLLKSACFWDCPCWTWRGAEFFGTLCLGDDEVAADIAANRHGLVATIVDLLDHKMPDDDEEEESSWTLKENEDDDEDEDGLDLTTKALTAIELLQDGGEADDNAIQMLDSYCHLIASDVQPLSLPAIALVCNNAKVPFFQPDATPSLARLLKSTDIATTMLVLISCTKPSTAGSKSYMGLSFALGFAVCLSEAEYPLLALDDLIPLLAAKTTQKGVGALYARASLAIINNVARVNVLGRKAVQIDLSGVKRDLQKRADWVQKEQKQAEAARSEATWLGKVMLGIDRISAERAPREKAELKKLEKLAEQNADKLIRELYEPQAAQDPKKSKKKKKKKKKGKAADMAEDSSLSSDDEVPGKGEWACGACTFVNQAGHLACSMCATPRPIDAQIAVLGVPGKPKPTKAKSTSDLMEEMAEIDAQIAALGPPRAGW